MNTYIVIFAIIWLGSVAVWWFVNRAFRSADVDKMKSRILDTAEHKKKTKTGPALPQLIQGEDLEGRLAVRLLKNFNLEERLGTLLEQAGLRWKPSKIVHLTLALFLGGFCAMRFVAGISFVPVQLLAGAALASLPTLYAVRCRKVRIHKFEELFPECLEFVSRSMRAGHAFSVSVEMIHREFQEPLAGEFRRTFDEHNLGLPLDQALLKLAKRVPILDVHFFVSAVLLQKRTGGNLAEILDKLAYVIRERFKLRGKIRAISAHGRLTGLALTLIPIGVAILMMWVNPDFIWFFLRDEIGHMLIGVAITFQILAHLVIKKIVSIEV
jgi:tight adherence protein B